MSTVERCSPHSPTPAIHGKDGSRHDALRPIGVIKRHGFFVMRLANKPPPNSQRVDFLDASTAHNSPVCWGRQEKSCTQQRLLVCKIFVVTALANSGRPALRVLTTLCDVASGGVAGPCLPTTRINYSTIATYGFGLMIADARTASYAKRSPGFRLLFSLVV